MCWFSKNERISTRKAVEGEELVVQDFPYRRWVASPQNSQKAVCLSNGCKLRLNEIPERLQKLLGVGPEAVAEFRELHRPPRTSLFAWLLPPLSLYDVLVFTDGNYIENAVNGKHVDHGTAVMKGDKACFTSAMTKEGELCWTTPPHAVKIGHSFVTTSDKGRKLRVTRVKYVKLEMPK